MSKEEKKDYVSKLGKEELEFFNEVVKKPFSDQAVAFLNAYWPKIGSQADHIFNVAWDIFKKVDMSFKGVEYVHKYEEGINLEFDAGLKFFEELCKYWADDGSKYTDEDYKLSEPVMMTALKRKKELRDKVDVNFDGHVSFMEYLLYQYQMDPSDLVQKLMVVGDEPPEVIEAKEALAAVQEKINAYEALKASLTKKSQGSGVKALTAKNQLAQLETGPQMEALRKELITAEAKVRAVIKKFGGKTLKGKDYDPSAAKGARWWLQKDLELKKEKYGKKK